MTRQPNLKPATGRLRELEAIIERGLPTYMEVGAALGEIREKRLYRPEHRTFEEYCRARWGWSSSYVNRQIRASRFFVPMGTETPANERQARGLIANGNNPAKQHFTDKDAVVDVPKNPLCRIGQMYMMGDHRLLIGDATNSTDVARLMARVLAALGFVDPPWNVSYVGKTKSRLTMQGDQMSNADYNEFLAKIFQSYRGIVKADASLYVCHPSKWQREFQNQLEAAGFEIRNQIIWKKHTFAWGHGRYKYQHEPIFYCHVAGEVDAWYGSKSEATVWSENKPLVNDAHPTMKPVDLIEHALTNSTQTGDVVVDLCGGSGSTLIACERTGRRARLMEIDPAFADVIIKRWQDYTGKKAILESDGSTIEKLRQTPEDALCPVG